MKHLPIIHIHSIPHKFQDYNTVGNYKKLSTFVGGWEFEISKMNIDYEFLVLIHELVEWRLTQKRGIKLKDIDDFDIDFEKNRKPGNTDEPGFDKKCPYRKEHAFATRIEKLIAKELGVDWETYDDTINNL